MKTLSLFLVVGVAGCASWARTADAIGSVGDIKIKGYLGARNPATMMFCDYTSAGTSGGRTTFTARGSRSNAVQASKRHAHEDSI